MTYATVRDEIHTQLSAVSGIGRVFKYPRLVSDWAQFLNLFKDSSDKINLAWIDRISAEDTPTGVGTEDATGEIEWTQLIETWQIDLYYGFKDDDSAPSMYTFQGLVDSISNKFRFLQNLNGVANKSWPVQLVAAGLFEFKGEVLCHRAIFQLRIRDRKLNQ